MPCRTDHMEPTARERHQREAAKHLVYIHGRMGQAVPPRIAEAATDIYGGQTDEWVKMLCTMLKQMNAEQIERIVYDAKDKRARRLADWYEEHAKVDAQRDWLDVIEAAQANPDDFESHWKMANMLAEGGYSDSDIASKISETSGRYFDFENSVHVFPFKNGVIILSGMDGLEGYRGTAA